MFKQDSGGNLIIGFVALVVLFISLTDSPENLNHEAQRWTMFIPSAIWAITGALGKKYPRMFLGAISALIWNPFAVVYFPSEIWLLVVLVFMALFIAVIKLEWFSAPAPESEN
ncbi:MAG: hypothetical protein RIS08_143 [Actinomycetota bacterium]|jgi:hypothetical protein